MVLIDLNSLLEAVLWGLTIAGSVIFLFSFIISVLGICGFDFLDDADDGSCLPVVDFCPITLDSLTAFFLVGGLSGLLLIKKFEYSPIFALAVGLFSGFMALASVVLLRYSFFKEPVCRASLLPIDQAIGCIADVQERIPRHGTGKVQVILNHYKCYLEAFSQDRTEIAPLSRVRITKVVGNNAVVVSRI